MIRELQAIVGAANVLVDPAVRAGYERDWTGRFGAPAAAVVRPGNLDEVVAVLRHCSATGIALVPQGGNTGLVGGGVPDASHDGHQIVLSTRRLNRVEPVDAAAGQVTVGAGVTLAQWRAAARRAGLDAPLDFAARDSATIGGAIATNAGGMRVVRFGTMRRQVVGVQAVLSDGTVVGSLAGLPKETMGVDWPSLLSGSEGTLAVITAARLRLVPHYARTATALAAVESVDAALALLARARQAANLDSIEVLLPEAVSLTAAHLGRAAPVTVDDGGCAVIVECAAHADPTDELAAILDGAPGVGQVAVAADAAGRDALSTLREAVPDAIAVAAMQAGGPVLKLDVAVPVASLPRLISSARAAARDDGCRLFAFGHLAEGNLHLNYVGVGDGAAISDRVLRDVAALGGAISAEHGIGRAKGPWLTLVRSTAELQALGRVRRALDPAGLLNPGVLEAPVQD